MQLKVIRIFFLVFFSCIILRLFYWQVLFAPELAARAEGQHFSSSKVTGLRGDILFADGSVLASARPTFHLYGLPKTLSLEEKKRLSNKLQQIFPEDEFLEQLSQDLYWVSLKKGVDFETKVSIEKLELAGIGFEQGYSRFYPEGSSSAHLLGFVGSNSKGEEKGYFGLEGFFDGELKGIPGVIRHEKDALGLPILIGKFLTNQAQSGKTLGLSVDRTVQFIVEGYLKKGIERYGAKAASAIVMDPKTGQILALASYPNYDPASFTKFPRDYYKNSVVADQYEPGSTFKVLVMAAAMNEDLIKADTTCDICSGPISIGGFTIRTWNNKYYPNTSMKDTIVHSDNTGMVFVGKKLGEDKLYEYLKNFGFGEVTNIDLQDEFSPDLRPRDNFREIDLATTSFGQGIAVTPIQMIRAVSVIANGGSLMEPHIVKEIKDDQGSFNIKPKVIKKVIKEETAKEVTSMMVAAVDEGEAKFAKPKGFKIAGKTGTAQIPIAGHYDPNKTIASFVGFAPADDPKFVMLVRYDQPSSSPYGSETAAPTFFEIAKELFPYFKIAPNE